MKALILAGGSGTRLWPLSRSAFPKQFLKLGKENRSLLQETVKRLLTHISKEDLYIITNETYFFDVQREVPEIPVENIILEPVARNTAPAIALALKFLMEERGVTRDEVLFVTPSDHIVAPLDAFGEYLKEAEKLAKQGRIVTFGVRPHKPETGYGYIKAKGNQVESFVEKPDKKTAQEYLLSGDYFWNAGMFTFRLKTMQEELEKHAPEIIQKLEGSFEEQKAESLDYAVMEKSHLVSMIPLELTWSDVGSWDNVYELFEKDEHMNAEIGDVIALETTNSLIMAEKRLVATIGVRDLLIVETDDVVLVAKREEAQKVKAVVEKLRERGKREVEDHLTTHRPWGFYMVLEEAERYKIKRIHVKPKQKLSLQLHYHRSEHWVIVKGTAKVTVNDKESTVHEGESIFVPKSAIHRVENPGFVPLEIIEVQVGEYLGEDDIVRLEDVYGRLKEKVAFDLLIASRQQSENSL